MLRVFDVAELLLLLLLLLLLPHQLNPSNQALVMEVMLAGRQTGDAAAGFDFVLADGALRLFEAFHVGEECRLFEAGYTLFGSWF